MINDPYRHRSASAEKLARNLPLSQLNEITLGAAAAAPAVLESVQAALLAPSSIAGLPTWVPIGSVLIVATQQAKSADYWRTRARKAEDELAEIKARRRRRRPLVPLWSTFNV